MGVGRRGYLWSAFPMDGLRGWMDGCCGFGGSRGGDGGDTRIIARDNVVAVVVDDDRSYSRAEESDGQGCLLIAPFPVFSRQIHTLLQLLAFSTAPKGQSSGLTRLFSHWAYGGGFS